MAVVVHEADPVTSDVANVWPSTKPVSVAVSGGLPAPKSRDLWSAVTVSGAFVTTIVNVVVPVFPSASVTVTVTGYVPGLAETEPVRVHVRVPGSVDASEVDATESASPAGRPLAEAVRPEPSVSSSVAVTVTAGDRELP